MIENWIFYRLFFLTRTDLLSMLFEAHNDLPAMYRYIAKIYPSISSLVLVKDTDLTINKTGYHPEIEGIISKDGEKIVFAEVMRVRLGVVSDLFSYVKSNCINCYHV